MLKKLKSFVSVLMLIVFTCNVLWGCDTEDGEKTDTVEVRLESVKKGFTKNSVYVIKAEDFEEFKEAALGGSWKRMSYKVPVVSEMSTGETYYIIGHTVGQTRDGSDIQLEGGRMQIIGREVYSGNGLINTYNAIDHLSSGSFGPDETEVVFERDTIYGDNSYDVSAEATGKKTEYFVYAEIKVKKEMKMCVNYHIKGTVSEDKYGEEIVGETAANVYYTQQIQLSNLKYRYLEGKDYVDGRYSESALKESIDMEIGKTYYLVVSVNVQSMLEKSDGETLTLETKIPHLSLLNGTLDSADSGNYTETVESGEKIMRVTFKIPDPDVGEKNYVFVYKLTPVSEEGYPWMTFKLYTTSEISVMGGLNRFEIELPFGKKPE